MIETLKNHKYIKLLGIFCLFAFGPVFIVNTNPDKLPLPLLIVPFIWLFVVLGLSIYMLLGIKKDATLRQRISISLLVAISPVLLLILQSIHQLSVRDVVIVFGLVLIMAFYLLRADFIR